MECQELRRDELAGKYLNQQLDPTAQDEFEVHVLECANCLRHVEVVQALRQELFESARRVHTAGIQSNCKTKRRNSFFLLEAEWEDNG